MSRYNYSRRKTHAVRVGNTAIGGDNPIRLQSMTNTSTLDTDGSAAQSIAIAKAGGDLVRLTTQGVREAANMAAIKQQIVSQGLDIPLAADVHFNPKAAYEAARTSDKVRINPGNFVDAPRTFRKLEFTDEEYREEIARIRAALLPFLDICREHGTAVRLGVNHGSLSDRIMSRYGDTPAGMVESVMEYLRICREVDFNDIVISIKASNTVVMTETVRLLVKTMESEGMSYPIHLGVTEAGDGEDGRVKSAVGIGALLAEGIGDTIRVSLSEPPENEIPVARHLVEHILKREGHEPIIEPSERVECTRDLALPIPGITRQQMPVAFHHDFKDFKDFNGLKNNMQAGSLPSLKGLKMQVADAASDPLNPLDVNGRPISDDTPVMLGSIHRNRVGEMQSWIDRFVSAGHRNPVILCLAYTTDSLEQLQIEAGCDFGTMLLNGYGSGICLIDENFDCETLAHLELGILQATRLRTTRTEYISCPGCGRTLFDLQGTLKVVRDATSHLKGLKIGVMGCIVNGPGEMADADYGYVGAGPGRVTLYKGKQEVVKNIPTDEALPRLIQLIRDNGDWIDL